jgi:hypothetical protein
MTELVAVSCVSLEKKLIHPYSATVFWKIRPLRSSVAMVRDAGHLLNVDNPDGFAVALATAYHLSQATDGRL